MALDFGRTTTCDITISDLRYVNNKISECHLYPMIFELWTLNFLIPKNVCVFMLFAFVVHALTQEDRMTIHDGEYLDRSSQRRVKRFSPFAYPRCTSMVHCMLFDGHFPISGMCLPFRKVPTNGILLWFSPFRSSALVRILWYICVSFKKPYGRYISHSM